MLQKISYGLQLKLTKLRRHISATQLVVLSFMAVIFLGSFFLSLPVSQAAGVSAAKYIDCLFTAVSATCVTGLVTVTTAVQWSLFGQLVILIMIQIGGLSLVTLFTFFAINIGKKINMRNRMAIQASLNQNTLQGMVNIVKLAIKGTFLLEGIGALSLFLFFRLSQGLPFGRSLYFGIFHSISSFCNAGFDVIGETSLNEFVAAPLLNLTVMILIVAGGIGFAVWKNITAVAAQALCKKKPGVRKKLSVHTKLALITTAVLIFSGAFYIFATEYNNPATLGQLSLGGKIWASFFQSVTLRTAGYYTISQNGLTDSSKFVSSIFMLVGGSPGGTAGGIKTLTLAVVVSSIWATLRGKKDNEVMGRRIPFDALRKAITVIGVMFSLWFIVATALEFTEAGSAIPYTFIDLQFEVASALGTVGLSTGLTPYLSNIGKVLIMLCMFIGRLGPISIAVALQRKLHNAGESVRLPEEDVLIG